MTRTHHIVILCLLVGFLYSCREKKEACIDVFATNFDASGDVNCCCQYPQLSIRTSYVINGGKYSPDSIFMDQSGNPYKVRSFNVLLSSFELIAEDNRSIVVTDNVEAVCNNVAQSLVDDFTLLSADEFKYTLGSIKDDAILKAIQFRLGVNPTHADCIVQDAEHPLSENSLLNSLGNHAFLSIQLVDTSDVLLKQYVLSDADYITSFVLQDSLKFGYNKEYKLELDLFQLLDGVDFSNQDSLQVLNVLKNNLTLAIYLN